MGHVLSARSSRPWSSQKFDFGFGSSGAPPFAGLLPAGLFFAPGFEAADLRAADFFALLAIVCLLYLSESSTVLKGMTTVSPSVS
jgi:hypothetical protein